MSFLYSFISFFLFLQAFLIPSHVLAQDNYPKLPQESINPGSILYPFKRLAEKVQVFLTFDEGAKLNLHKKLLRKRLYELSYLVENKNVTPLERASQRFSYQAGILVENLEKKEGTEVKNQVKKEFDNYKLYLSKLRDNFPANSSNWLLLQQSKDTLDILSQKL